MKIQELHNNFPEALKLLEKTVSYFKENSGFIPVMAIELEFFYAKKEDLSDTEIDELNSEITIIAKNNGIAVSNITKEIGKGQYEINLKHSSDILKIISDLIKLKNIISENAATYGIEAIFLAKPYGDEDVGSGMHFHLSLQDESQNNLFKKQGNVESNLLLYSVSGMLELMAESIVFFIRNELDFKRFKSKINIPEKEIRYRANVTNAPTNISWGNNNRTTTIRIPDSHNNPEERRIEHRLACSNSCPALAATAILISCLHGLKNKKHPCEKIYGNAFDAQYHLDLIPENLNDALIAYKDSTLSEYIKKIC